ncbi:WXG100 family type VII secretion target [Brachybacterium huguangmaarense]|uniref:WXG100 family type VII secretion target n=1 Tax=Brachybacterium huguangmaarense TaxID=1652028 RepID=A0ABY6G420_9MICO|nr:WXG100 family type VII secretion target [Brachybacterium huguangmaarense]UYG17954.1 WXG100 family type VII secretion target [Brachybacterium huguangmaarense]
MGEADFHGADPTALEELAAEVGAAVDLLGALEQAVETILGTLDGGCWVGPDADAFGAALGDWRRRAHEAAVVLDARGTELRDHGEEQEAASASETAAGATSRGLPTVPGARGWPGLRSLVGSRSGPGDGRADDLPVRARGPLGPNMMIATPETTETLDRLLREHVPGYSRLPEMPVPDRSQETPAERLVRLSRM